MFMSRCLALILSLTVSSSLSLQSKPYFQIIEEAVNLVQSGGKLNIEENFVDTVRYLKDFPRQILYGNEFGATKYNVSGNCSHSVQAVTSSAVAQPKSNTWALQSKQIHWHYLFIFTYYNASLLQKFTTADLGNI